MARTGAMVADSVASPLSSVTSAPLGAARSMASAGTGAAGGLNPAQYVTQVLQMVQGLVTVGTTGAQVVGQVASTLAEVPVAAPVAAALPATPFTAPVVNGVPGAVSGTAPALPLQEARVTTMLAGGGAQAQAAVPLGTTAASTPGMTPMAPGPMGAAGAAARAAGAGGGFSAPSW